MITEQRKVVLKTADRRDLEVDINYSSAPMVADCKMFRFTLGKTVFEISAAELTSLLMSTADENIIRKLLPTKFTTVKVRQRMLFVTFKATQDYHKGEEIACKVPWVDQVVTEDEVMSGHRRKTKMYDSKGKIIHQK